MPSKKTPPSFIHSRPKPQGSWWGIFRQNLIASFNDLHYYAAVLNFPFKLSVKLILSFYLFVAIFVSGKLYFQRLPQLEQTFDQFSQQINSDFPEDVEIGWDGERLTTQPAQTITIASPIDSSNSQSPDNWITVNTQTDQDPSDANSFFFINQHTMYSLNFQDNYQSFPLETLFENESPTFTKTSIQRQLDQARLTYFRFKPLLAVFAIPFLWLGIFLARGVMIAIDSVMIYFFFSLLKRPLPYRKVFQLSLHVLIPAEILHQVSTTLYPQLDFPMLSLAYWIILSIIIWHFRNLRIVKIKEEKKK